MPVCTWIAEDILGSIEALPISQRVPSGDLLKLSTKFEDDLPQFSQNGKKNNKQREIVSSKLLK
jgi:hypothetical protein